MESKGSYALVGLFVLLVGVAMIASLFWLAGWGRGSETIYLVHMEESVSGLAVDAPVKYRGVDVGRVQELGLMPDDPEVIELTLSIDPATPVLTDTRAQLEFQGLTGLAFVNLVGGTRGKAPLTAEPGAAHPVIRSAPSILVRLDNGVSDLLVSVTQTSDRLAGLLEEVDREQLARTLTNLDRLAAALAEPSGGLGSAVQSADRFLGAAADVGDRLPQLVDRIDALTAEWESTSVEIRAMAASADQGLQRVTRDVSGNADVLTADLRQLADRLEQVIQDLEEDPTMMIYGRAPAPRGPGE